ncbi:Protein of unknown function [Pyronema omphalodes CBS 100304]|uniref:Uncharacterized protein n=1 Tax=Pyronema omphalodes (strain CBS 100304) TaxID=1076935 RepID=U4L647_PYROM|nr:Protein of unknown function [Pyronema omphalodes CBS 100304]
MHSSWFSYRQQQTVRRDVGLKRPEFRSSSNLRCPHRQDIWVRVFSGIPTTSPPPEPEPEPEPEPSLHTHSNLPVILQTASPDFLNREPIILALCFRQAPCSTARTVLVFAP